MSSSGKARALSARPNSSRRHGVCSIAGRTRAGAGRGVIVEGVVRVILKYAFNSPLAPSSGVHFCAPVGHRQQDGDYRESGSHSR